MDEGSKSANIHAEKARKLHVGMRKTEVHPCKEWENTWMKVQKPPVSTQRKQESSMSESGKSRFIHAESRREHG